MNLTNATYTQVQGVRTLARLLCARREYSVILLRSHTDVRR